MAIRKGTKIFHYGQPSHGGDRRIYCDTLLTYLVCKDIEDIIVIEGKISARPCFDSHFSMIFFRNTLANIKSPWHNSSNTKSIIFFVVSSFNSLHLQNTKSELKKKSIFSTTFFFNNSTWKGGNNPDIWTLSSSLKTVKIQDINQAHLFLRSIFIFKHTDKFSITKQCFLFCNWKVLSPDDFLLYFFFCSCTHGKYFKLTGSYF